MAYVIGEDCIACGTCIDECPVGVQSVVLVQVFVRQRQFLCQSNQTIKNLRGGFSVTSFLWL